jgi:ATP adenylyltransferase
MDRLWAPWRLAYVSAAGGPLGITDECFFCRGLKDSDDRKNLIVFRGSRSCVFLNCYPYNNGHLLVAPLAHKSGLDDLTSGELLDLQEVLRNCVRVLQEQLTPAGFNVGLNLGRVAGAGLPGHLHWHIVPRWNGDTNFMPVVGDTKVISQSLEALYEMLVGKLT